MNALGTGQLGDAVPVVGETTVLELRPAPASLVIRGFWAVVVGAAIVAGGIVMAVMDWYPTAALWVANGGVFLALVVLAWEAARRRATRYVLTTRRLTWREGVLSKFAAEAILGAVQNVMLSRSLVERLLGVGTIGVATAGTDDYEIVWRHVAGPEGVLSAIRGAVDRWTPGPDEPRCAYRAPVEEPEPVAPNSPPTPRLASIPVIGLAGGIGSGKSHIAREFARLGCYVIDSDARAKAALDRVEVRETLLKWWGERVLGADGRVDRARVAEIVFADPQERERLESLVHPIVRQDRARLIAEAAKFWPKAVIVDAPLLFEAGVDKECDAVIFVDAPRAIRAGRVRDARGWDEAELDRRESAQWPLDRKRALSAFVLQNQGANADLPERLTAILESVVKARTGPGATPEQRQ